MIPINLRSFSPEWDRKPAYQFEATKRQIRHAERPLQQALDPLLRTLHLLDEQAVTQTEYKTTPVYCGTEQVGLVRDFDNPSYLEVTPERTRNKMIFHYMYPLGVDHPKLVALREIVALADDYDLNIVFYVSPVDVETGERLLPGRFREQVAANVDTIREAVGTHQPALIDMSDALPSTAFSWHDYPNEHLRDTGRRFVAERLASQLEGSENPEVGGWVEASGPVR